MLRKGFERLWTSLVALTLAGGAVVAAPSSGFAQKISATSGGFTGTILPGDNFGISVTHLPDLDGDGVDEIAVGADTDSTGGTWRGAVWILFMNADATVKSHQKISDLDGGFTGGLLNGDRFGVAIDAFDDLDGDGNADLIVGAWGADTPVQTGGTAYILFLNANGTVREHQEISSGIGGFVGPLDEADQFGRNVANLGDVDGDGNDDVAIGITRQNTQGQTRGGVWILFLDADGTVKAERRIVPGESGFVGDLDPGDRWGRGLAALGDLDNDGVNDLAVGAAHADDGGTSAGEVWVLLLNADGTVKTERKISNSAGGFAGALDSGDFFGLHLTGLGDLDGDTVEDLAVGALGDDDGGPDQGAVWILFLNTDGTVKVEQKVSAGAGTFPGVIDDEDHFGTAVTSIGDFNGDGITDLAVSAEFDDDGATNTGAVWLALMATDGTSVPTCGDGILQEPAEQCDDGNTVGGDGCSEFCTCAAGPDADSDTIPDVCDDCPLDPDNDIDGDGVCGDVDPCPFDPDDDVDSDGFCGDVDNCPTVSNSGQEDLDFDGVGDACQVCSIFLDPSQLLTTKAKVRFKFVNTDPGPEIDDRVQIKGDFSLPAGATFGDLDPQNAPTRIVVNGADGGEILNVTASTSSFSSNVGWDLNGSGKKWRYRDRSGSAPGGIQLILLTDRSKKAPGLVRLKVTGKNGDYPVVFDSEPVTAIVEYGDITVGLCTHTNFDGPFDCRFQALGQTLTCKK